MTLIEMAREAGLRDCTCDGKKGCLERFAALVAEKERERFSLECIDLVAMYGGPVDLEAAIRARAEND